MSDHGSSVCGVETTREREDLLKIVAEERRNFLYTLEGITDEQAAARTTVSELTLGGLVKHVAGLQRDWLAVLDGTVPDLDPDQRRMTESECCGSLRTTAATPTSSARHWTEPAPRRAGKRRRPTGKSRRRRGLRSR